MASTKIRLGVIYGLSMRYATSIRIYNLTKNLENIKLSEITIDKWSNKLLGKIWIMLKNIGKVLDPNFKVDYIYFSAPLIVSSIPALVANVIRKIPLIADWDDGYHDFDNFKPKIWQIAYREYLSLKKSEKIVVVSHKLKEMAKNLGKSEQQIWYIPNGVDLNIFDPQKYDDNKEKFKKKLGIKENEKVFGFVGSINKVGLDNFVGKDILECAIKLNKKGLIDNVKFFIVGFGDGLDVLKQAIKNAGLEDKFIFTDYVEHKEIPKYINLFDLGIIPFDETSFSAQTRSSCKLKEYMAMNVPIITVGIGENFVDLEDGKYGILVKRNSELCKGIAEFIKDIEGYKNTKSRIKAQDYGFGKLSVRLEEFILR